MCHVPRREGAWPVLETTRSPVGLSMDRKGTGVDCESGDKRCTALRAVGGSVKGFPGEDLGLANGLEG